MPKGNGKANNGFDMVVVEQGSYGVKFHGGLWAWTARRNADDRTHGHFSGSKKAAERAALEFLGVNSGDSE